jgi:PHD/YefM family antitoxin component YafN of YafNO toxin-antitoxin module
MTSESKFASIEETRYLLQSAPNAKRLLESITELDAGKGSGQLPDRATSPIFSRATKPPVTR